MLLEARCADQVRLWTDSLPLWLAVLPLSLRSLSDPCSESCASVLSLSLLLGTRVRLLTGTKRDNLTS